jgi:hypothetical protein
MATIITKLHGPSNVRGARVSAKAGDKFRVIISWPMQLSGEHVHRAAVSALLDKIEKHCVKEYGEKAGKDIASGWRGQYASGYLSNDTMCHVHVDSAFTPLWNA